MFSFSAFHHCLIVFYQMMVDLNTDFWRFVDSMKLNWITGKDKNLALHLICRFHKQDAQPVSLTFSGLCEDTIIYVSFFGLSFFNASTCFPHKICFWGYCCSRDVLRLLSLTLSGLCEEQRRAHVLSACYFLCIRRHVVHVRIRLLRPK